jgi:pseudaminic acid cytidylyltransferase
VNVAIIPARGGSRRIPRKNIRPFHGKPIIAHSIETALASGLFDGGVWVSSETPEIGRIAEEYGAGFIVRPPHLAEIGADDCGTQEVTRHAIEALIENGRLPSNAHMASGGHLACCIYPTAPLMRVEDLSRGHFVLTHPAWQHMEFAMSVGTEPLRDAGQFYWGKTWAFLRRVDLLHNWTVMIRIPEARVCDINAEADWQEAERMYARLKSGRTGTTLETA